MPNKKIFITGATGRIGRHLLKRMETAGCRIYALCRSCSHDHDFAATVIKGDLLDQDSYAKVFEEGIDAVVHMGAVTYTNDSNKYYEVNDRATRKLVKICESNAVKKMVFISTCAASDNSGHYGVSKLMAETFVRDSKLNWVILRLSEVYGLSDEKGVYFVLSSLKNTPFIFTIGNGKYLLAPVHISDVVEAVAKAAVMDNIANKAYNIAGPEVLTYNEMVDRVLRIHGLKKTHLHVPVFVARLSMWAYGRLSASQGFFVSDQLPRLFSKKDYDISDASRDFGYSPSRIEKHLSWQ